MIHLYWSIVALVLGGCIGSFLNVVIFRWSRDMSISKPARSFCPACEHAIAWYDNIPVLSYLLLRGRCRHCHAGISVQYPIVELATAVVFVLTYDTFFVSRLRVGIGESLIADWPMLVAHWLLFAGLIALTVMDLEMYIVDVRVTWLIAAVGMVAHTFWTPATSEAWIRPGPTQGALALAVVVGLGLSGLIFRNRMSLEPEQDLVVDESEEEEPATPPPTSSDLSRWAWLVLPLGLVLFYLIVIAGGGESSGPERWRPPTPPPGPVITERPIHQAPDVVDASTIRVAIGLGILFLAMALAASHPRPEADAEIVEAIHEEASQSRRHALSEFGFIAPALVLGIAAVIYVGILASPGPGGLADRVLHWRPVEGATWQPIWGLATAAIGWVIAGAIGWLARIGFTLLFGKEALGMGDVHILAAAGAVAGWPVAFAGFFLAAPLALVAVLVIHLRRQSRALPYGPWLAMAFLLACMFQDAALMYADLRWLFE